MRMNQKNTIKLEAWSMEMNIKSPQVQVNENSPTIYTAVRERRSISFKTVLCILAIFVIIAGVTGLIVGIVFTIKPTIESIEPFKGTEIVNTRITEMPTTKKATYIPTISPKQNHESDPLVSSISKSTSTITARFTTPTNTLTKILGKTTSSLSPLSSTPSTATSTAGPQTSTHDSSTTKPFSSPKQNGYDPTVSSVLKYSTSPETSPTTARSTSSTNQVITTRLASEMQPSLLSSSASTPPTTTRLITTGESTHSQTATNSSDDQVIDGDEEKCPYATGAVGPLYAFGTNCDAALPPLDDSGAHVLVLPTDVPLIVFGKTPKSVYININGVLSFDYPKEDFIPIFPSPNETYLAPFFSDVDTSCNGSVFYRRVTSEDTLNLISKDINLLQSDYNSYQASWAFIATWFQVPYFKSNDDCDYDDDYDINSSYYDEISEYDQGFDYYDYYSSYYSNYSYEEQYKDSRNTFQAAFTTNGSISLAIFNYESIEWTTGSESGGNSQGLGGISPAEVGVNGEDGEYCSVPASGTHDIVNIDVTTNVGVPGRWIFRIDKVSDETYCQ